MATRRELKAAIGERYREAVGRERRQILEEFVRTTGYHRKHALRVLNQMPIAAPVRSHKLLYDEAVLQALTILWEAGDRICGKRLKALIPVLVEAMERRGYLQLDPTIKNRLLRISAASIDRLLQPVRPAGGAVRRRRWGMGSAIKQSVPVRTFADWGEHRRVTARPIWSNIAAALRKAATMSTASPSPISTAAGPNAQR
jgi:hypothetical protein